MTFRLEPRSETPSSHGGLETITNMINQSNGVTSYGPDIAVTALLTLHDAGYWVRPGSDLRADAGQRMAPGRCDGASVSRDFD